MANYLFVHGGNVSATTWNQLLTRQDYPENGYLLGGEVWSLVAAKLKALGHNVFTPTLGDEYKHNLSSHIQQIVTLIEQNSLSEIILVAHSYGGMIITAVASQLRDRISHLVYIDAALPEVGQSLFDLLEQGEIDPTDIISGSPQAYTEKIIFNPHPLQTIPKHYLRCTHSEFLALTAQVKEKIMADSDYWEYTELATGHLPMATMPDNLAQYLLSIG